MKMKANGKETQSDTDSIVKPSSGGQKKHSNPQTSSSQSKRNINSRSDYKKDPYTLYNNKPANPKNPSNRLSGGNNIVSGGGRGGGSSGGSGGNLAYSGAQNPNPTKNPKAGQGFFTERAITPNPNPPTPTTP
jgi:hypothetical protein